MSFIRPVPWTRQPHGIARVGRVGLASGIVFCAPLNNGMAYSAIDGSLGTKTGLGSTGVNKNGVYPVFGSSNYVDFPILPSSITGSTPTTIAWSQEPRSTSAYSGVLEFSVQGTSNPFLIFLSATDSTYYFSAGQRSGASAQALFGGVGAVTNNVVDRYVLRLPAGITGANTNFVLMRNGVSVARTAATNFGVSTTTGFRIGALSSGSDPFEGLIGDVTIWARYLSDAESASWSNNPWQTLQPLTRRLVVPSTGAAPAFLGAWARGSTTLVGSGMPGG